MKIAAVILAAGKGTRMNEGQASEIPKVMFQLNGKPIIDCTIKNVKNSGISRILLIVGYKKELIEQYFKDGIEYAVQEKQLGTGHAVLMAKDILAGKSDTILVGYGDMPLITSESIERLMDVYEKSEATIALLSVNFNDPMPWEFSRVIRNSEGDVDRVVEQKDCTPEELEIKECNTGYYIFNADWLWQNIENINTDNAQGEYYLTDLIKMAREQNKKIVAAPVLDENEALGINTQAQLKEAEEILKSR